MFKVLRHQIKDIEHVEGHHLFLHTLMMFQYQLENMIPWDTVPRRQFWDCGGWKSDSLRNFSIEGCQWTVNCLLGLVHVWWCRWHKWLTKMTQINKCAWNTLFMSVNQIVYTTSRIWELENLTAQKNGEEPIIYAQSCFPAHTSK